MTNSAKSTKIKVWTKSTYFTALFVNAMIADFLQECNAWATITVPNLVIWKGSLAWCLSDVCEFRAPADRIPFQLDQYQNRNSECFSCPLYTGGCFFTSSPLWTLPAGLWLSTINSRTLGRICSSLGKKCATFLFSFAHNKGAGSTEETFSFLLPAFWSYFCQLCRSSCSAWVSRRDT